LFVSFMTDPHVHRLTISIAIAIVDI